MELVEVAQALASPVRVGILGWLVDPESFTSRRDGDLSEDGGVCVSLLAERAGVSQPTISRHLDVLRRAGLVSTERRRGFTYHFRDEDGIECAHQLLADL